MSATYESFYSHSFNFCGNGGTRICPLAAPEKIIGLTPNLDFFDRCANPCSLSPPPAALAGVARASALGFESSLFYQKTKKDR